MRILRIDSKAAKKHLRPVILEPMRAAREALAELPVWVKGGIADKIEAVASRYELSLGKLGQPIRVAVTGGPVSPPIDVTIWLVGRERVLNRLDNAIRMIEERTQASGN
jgi:glutamyl-tRNA synthetase